MSSYRNFSESLARILPLEIVPRRPKLALAVERITEASMSVSLTHQNLATLRANRVGDYHSPALKSGKGAQSKEAKPCSDNLDSLSKELQGFAHNPSSVRLVVSMMKQLLSKMPSKMGEFLDNLRGLIDRQRGEKAEDIEKSKPKLADDTLDIESYMGQTFEGKSHISEKEAYLTTVGWGFNVMADYAGNPKLREYYNEKME